MPGNLTETLKHCPSATKVNFNAWRSFDFRVLTKGWLLNHTTVIHARKLENWDDKKLSKNGHNFNPPVVEYHSTSVF